MTKLTTSREIRLASRPKGIPTAANFILAETTLPPLQAQQVLVRNLFMSVDPYMRGRMNERKSYVPPFEIGQALEGGAIGEVIESLAGEFKPGDVVTAVTGREVHNVAELLTQVASLKPGTAAPFDVQRASGKIQLQVTPGVRPWPQRQTE